MRASTIAIISFLFFASCSCSGRLLGKNILIASDNRLAFDLNLNSTIENVPRGLEKDAVLHCCEDASPSSEKNGPKDENLLLFRLSPSPVIIQNKNKADESALSDKAEPVFHLLPKGKVTPSGPSPKVNSMLTDQRLSKSKRSPGVGHMQIVWPRAQTISGEILKFGHNNGDDKRNKRKLRSTPSPGGGH